MLITFLSCGPVCELQCAIWYVNSVLLRKRMKLAFLKKEAISIGYISAQIKKLQTVQNRALRLIFNVDNRHHRRNLYEDLKIDCLSVKVKKCLLILIFKLIHHIAPESLCSRITFKENVYDLRNHKCILNLEKPRSNFMKNSSLYTATRLFNALPENLRIENNINSFTRGIAHIYPLPF